MSRSCGRCGALADTGDDLPLGWSSASTPAGVALLCGACTREHVRAIEAKLPEEWWS